MNPTLSYLLGKKMWWVCGINVWGSVAAFEPQFLITETEGSSKRLVFTTVALGGSVQQLEYGDLADVRGNKLPELLINPRVLPIAKGNIPVVLQGSEGEKSFTLAKSAQTSQVATVDLLIIEMG
ncbi:MAG: hypothetical protein E4G91_07925 [Candidatus Zixiibacteriota bacterium]|nr:MAG: hypothetical protein E4G91_07925 [candidate division Zixibacteria bacterium]